MRAAAKGLHLLDPVVSLHRLIPVSCTTQHHVSTPSNTGIMSHFWTTGTSQQALASAGLEVQVTYTFDDASPSPHSVTFDPAKAVGQFFGAVNFNGTWTDGTRAATPQNLSLFSAGDKAGKNAVVEGWWHQTKMPFQDTVAVNLSVVPRGGGPVPASGACATFYMVVRAYRSGVWVVPLATTTMIHRAQPVHACTHACAHPPTPALHTTPARYMYGDIGTGL